jgi:ParB/RepB/Spo0J family partition protein
MATKPRLELLAPTKIRQNPENPRVHFPEAAMEELSASIDEVGILVPISVYEEKGKSKPFVLIDGERRWRCATHLGLSALPAIVMPPPDSTKNLLTMFNIHMVREPWEDMPTAWALKKLMERTGDTDVDRLAELTSLRKEQIRRLLTVLKLPKDYQALIDEGKIPMNFFYELQRNVIDPLAKQRPAIFKKFGEKKIRDSFVQKKLANVTNDLVELRDVRPIIAVAAQEAGAPEEPSDLDPAIEELIEDRNRTIRETYERTVEMVVEAEKFARQCELLVEKFDRLMRKAQDKADRDLVMAAVRRLGQQLQARTASPAPV